MNISELRTLVAILECGSMSSAARRIGYSTAAISRQISRLERRYDVRLFEPSGRTIRPTETALRLGAQARELFGVLDRMEATLKGAPAPEADRIPVSAGGYWAAREHG